MSSDSVFNDDQKPDIHTLLSPGLFFSGGKDSCYNMMQCIAAGHCIVALANLRPDENQGKDLTFLVLSLDDCSSTSLMQLGKK